jgi:hypothetical protein
MSWSGSGSRRAVAGRWRTPKSPSASRYAVTGGVPPLGVLRQVAAGNAATGSETARGQPFGLGAFTVIIGA